VNARRDHGGGSAAPTVARPWWLATDGRRVSFAEVEAEARRGEAARLAELHAVAIGRIAHAALRARLGKDQAEARRLATAAGRLCLEAAGMLANPYWDGRKHREEGRPRASGAAFFFFCPDCDPAA
jgi:hypothetical protein